MKDFDLDEIVFENRNKNYGAYFLRKHYRKYIIISLIIASTCFSAIVIIPFLSCSTRVYQDGTPMGLKYAQLITEHLEFPKEKEVLEPATEMMKLKPIVVDSRSSSDIFKGKDDNSIYEYGKVTNSANLGILETRPSFRGGDIKDFNMWVITQFTYPKEAFKNRITGIFTTTFIIEKDGSVSNVKLQDDADLSIANEIKRVIYSSPKWSPGIKSGKPVRVMCSISLTLSIK